MEVFYLNYRLFCVASLIFHKIAIIIVFYGLMGKIMPSIIFVIAPTCHPVVQFSLHPGITNPINLHFSFDQRCFGPTKVTAKNAPISMSLN